MPPELTKKIEELLDIPPDFGENTKLKQVCITLATFAYNLGKKDRESELLVIEREMRDKIMKGINEIL